MSKNIFKTAPTNKSSNNKGFNNNRFSSLKDELNEPPVENSNTSKEIKDKKKEKEKEKEKSRFNFDDDEVNVFTVENTQDNIKDTKVIQNNTHTHKYTNTHNSFTNLKPPVIKEAESVPFIYTEDAFPELLVKTTNKTNNQPDTNEELHKMTLVEKLKSKYNEDIEENKRKQEEKRIQEEKDYVKPGWVYIKRDPNTKKWSNNYGNNQTIIVQTSKTLNEHMNYWVDSVVDRYERRKEVEDNYYGYNHDFIPEHENNIDYFDMLDEKAEQEKAKEEKEIINNYLNDNEDDDNDNYESYSNDYWKKIIL